MKFLGCNSQLKRVQTSGRSVLEATYCKQCVRINEPNLGSFAGIHSLLLTPIHTELKAVSVMEINNMNNQILVWLIFKNTFSFWLFCANERKAVCFYCTHLGLWLVHLRIQFSHLFCIFWLSSVLVLVLSLDLGCWPRSTCEFESSPAEHCCTSILGSKNSRCGIWNKLLAGAKNACTLHEERGPCPEEKLGDSSAVTFLIWMSPMLTQPATKSAHERIFPRQGIK